MGNFKSGTSVAAQWRSVRRLYPIYTDLADKFELGAPPFADLDQFGGASEADVIEQIQAWLAEMDERIQPHQFRQMLQSSGFAHSEEKLNALVRRHLEKPGRGHADRDKLDFLLTQYLTVCSPPSFQARELSLEEVAQILEPVLGESGTDVPQWLEPLEQLIQQVRGCNDLEQFESLAIVQRGRELKASTGEKFFTSTTLLGFTRFSYLLRYTFARLFASEAQRIDQGLQELEGRGIAVVDGTDAGLSANEPIETIRELLHATTTSAAPAYSADNTVKRLCALRAAIEDTLSQTKSMLTPVDQARFDRVEFELGELRKDMTQLRHEVEQVRVALAGLTAERVAANSSESPSSQPQPPQLQVPQLQEAASEAVGSAVNSATPEITDFSAEVNECLARVRKSVQAKGSKASGVLRIGTGALLLSEGEVEFLKSNGDAKESAIHVIGTAVGLRALLLEKCELSKTGQGSDLTSLIKFARDVLCELQRLGGMHGPHHNTTASTARQLWSVIQQVEKITRDVRSRESVKGS